MLRLLRATLYAAALKFELAGQGHVVVVERNDGSPLIRMDHPDGGILRKERLYFGRIGGRWEILG